MKTILVCCGLLILYSCISVDGQNNLTSQNQKSSTQFERICGASNFETMLITVDNKKFIQTVTYTHNNYQPSTVLIIPVEPSIQIGLFK